MDGRRVKRDDLKFVIKNNYFVAEGEQRNEEHDSAVNLKRLQEMFSDCLDADVVEMMFNECSMNVDKSVEQLLVLCEETNTPSHSSSHAVATCPNSAVNEHRSAEIQPLSSTRVIDFANAVKTTMNTNNVKTKSTNISKNNECSVIDEVTKCIKQNVKVIVLMRGLPGSGKSTLANQFVRHTNGVVYSSDDYFTSKNGIYQFDWSKLSEAHYWNQKRSSDAMKNSITPIFIDNTNLEEWEMKPYVVMGHDNGYEIYFLEPNTHWKYKTGHLARCNKHSIKKEKIELMKSRFDRNITVDKMISSIKKERKQEVQTRKRSTSNVNTEEASPSKIDLDLLMVLNQHHTDSESSSRNTSENGSYVSQEGFWEKDDEFTWSESSNLNPVGTGSGSTIVTQVNFVTPKPQRERKPKTDMSSDNWTTVDNAEKNQSQSQSRRLLGSVSRQKNNWEFPPFPSESCVEIDERTATDRFVYLKCVSTQTENMDWALLEIKQNEVESADIISENIFLAKNITEDIIVMPSNRISRAVKIDRGTLTSDIPGVFTFEEKIKKLKESFSQAQESHLREVLNACHEDIDWAFNLLSEFSDDHFSSVELVKTQQETDKPQAIAQRENASFTLRLEPSFCMQLQNVFGSVIENSITIDNCHVNISHGVAKLLHHLWKKTLLQQKQQQQSNRSNGFLNEKNSVVRGKEPLVSDHKLVSSTTSGVPSSFKEIMDFEMAVNLSWNDYYTCENENSDEYKDLLSTKLKREQLYNTYPGIDRQILDGVFEAHGFRLSDTIATVDQSVGIYSTLTDATEIWVTAETVSNGAKARVKQCIPFDTHPRNGVSPTTEKTEEEMQEIRSKMMDFNRKRKESINKARQSYERKNYAVASYYSSQAREYQNQMDIASKQVIQNILNATTSNKLDLHGLHSSEVLITVSTYLKWKMEELKRKKLKQSHVDIITGWGAHSDSAPKIRPIVLNYLASKKYKFQSLNAGEFRVTLTQ